MKYINKFTTFLLENKPLLWHTRFVQLTIAGILLWILSYIAGYLSTDLDVLRNYSLNRHYTRSSFIFYHIGLIVIILAIWAIYYYKNNAFKSFYPISRFYFHKILGLLFIPLMIMSSATISFDAGVRAKTNSIFSLSQLRKDADIINLTTPFLFLENAHYDIRSKAYPAPFPLQHIHYNIYKEEWQQNYDFLTVIDESLQQEGKYPYKSYSLDEKNTTIIEGNKYQFYSSKTMNYGNCITKNVVDSFYVFDSITASKIEITSIKNYSGLVIHDSIYLNKNKDTVFSNMDSQRLIFASKYSRKIARIVDEKDFDEIEKYLIEFQKVLVRYGVPHNLNTMYIKLVLQARNFRIDEKLVDKQYNKNHKRYFSPEPIDVSHYKSPDNQFVKTGKEIIPNYQYFEQNELRNIFNNYSRARTSNIWNDHWIFSAFFAVALAFLFIFFEIVKPIPFIISLPVWGVLFILFGIVVASGNIKFTGSLFGMLMLLIIVQTLNIIFLTNKTISKRILNISYAMALACAPFVLGVLLVWINEFTVYEFYTECSNYGEKKHILGGALESSFALWLSGLIGILIILFLPRIWKAREE